MQAYQQMTTEELLEAQEQIAAVLKGREAFHTKCAMENSDVLSLRPRTRWIGDNKSIVLDVEIESSGYPHIYMADPGEIKRLVVFLQDFLRSTEGGD